MADDEPFDLRAKKKKKKKVKDDTAENEGAPEEGTGDATDQTTPTTVTKEKKGKSVAFADQGEENKENPPEHQPVVANDTSAAAPGAGEEDDADELSFLKKKKKKKATTGNVDDTKKDTGDEPTPVPNVSSGGDYSYDELLTRVFNIMKEKNPDMDAREKIRLTLKPPQVARIGTKRTSFSNFGEICKSLKRQEKHLHQYLLAELGTTGSVDANNALTIKGRFQQKQIESVLRSYIKEYVICKTCRSPETLLQKEERLSVLQCTNCRSRYFVSGIKTGFQAQVGKRAATRAKTA
ncbi:unnamed protein product [Didymodactylos carnosus]|uniref:Eukaryotic translation initiation factor 2 subunit 2 n=1 Tax=Didymodactylos carnosus TaxID=1234261 RepID=A0A813QHQ4_9BILA|nr:unnamed protein product [Didymodactylos carnosus]CAF0831781.1 unnamed protein product [Didymodactylos carnosus]CAF3548844.1 unnamed protein product [Didymodactylos carnosus]CAF3616324.1 unnamed protein product [Didymodactylos carnosus]